jgi:hypothetical protein
MNSQGRPSMSPSEVSIGNCTELKDLGIHTELESGKERTGNSIVRKEPDILSVLFIYIFSIHQPWSITNPAI